MTRLALPLAAVPAAPVPTTGPLADSFGRIHTDLRVSVTDRCNLRCTYCMPEDVTFRPQSELLTFEEITRFVTWLVPLGVRRVRLTGGEPLLRRDLDRLVAQLAAVPGLDDLSLTTNGLLLAAQAGRLRQAGLKRLNVSLDTLDESHFERLARRRGLGQVLAGITEAKRVGFTAVKVNAVALRGFIDADLVPLAEFCRREGLTLRLIETMPIGGNGYDPAEFVAAAELLDRLAREVAPLEIVPDADPHAPARTYRYTDGSGQVGVIATVSEPFCGQCDRLRLTAEGALRNCLFATTEADLKPAVRANDRATTERQVREHLWAKAAGHGSADITFATPSRTMHAIGG